VDRSFHATPVISIEVTVAPRRCAGEYTLKLQANSGETAYLVGGLNRIPPGKFPLVNFRKPTQTVSLRCVNLRSALKSYVTLIYTPPAGERVGEGLRVLSPEKLSCLVMQSQTGAIATATLALEKLDVCCAFHESTLRLVAIAPSSDFCVEHRSRKHAATF
jgi:hypothetical protein